MSDEVLRIQPCGCISLPEEICSALGIGPGSRLALTPDHEHRRLLLRALDAPDGHKQLGSRAACPVPSPES